MVGGFAGRALLNPVLRRTTGQGTARELLEDPVGQLLLTFHQLAVNLCNQLIQLLRIVLESCRNAEFPPMVALARHIGIFDDCGRGGLALSRPQLHPAAAEGLVTNLPAAVADRQ